MGVTPLRGVSAEKVRNNQRIRYAHRWLLLDLRLAARSDPHYVRPDLLAGQLSSDLRSSEYRRYAPRVSDGRTLRVLVFTHAPHVGVQLRCTIA